MAICPVWKTQNFKISEETCEILENRLLIYLMLVLKQQKEGKKNPKQKQKQKRNENSSFTSGKVTGY